MNIHRFALAVAALSLAACATRPPVAYVAMSYTSSPSGARVVRDGVTIGRTPMTLYVKAPLMVSEANGSVTSECLTPVPVLFQWASGAKTTVASPCKSASENSSQFAKVPGAQKQYTASVSMSATRPVGAPDLKRDQRTAMGLTYLASIPFPTPRTDSDRRNSLREDFEYVTKDNQGNNSGGLSYRGPLF